MSSSLINCKLIKGGYNQCSSKTFKRQLDDTEEEVARAYAYKRKLKRDHDELMEHNEAMQRVITLLQNKTRQVLMVKNCC